MQRRVLTIFIAGLAASMALSICGRDGNLFQTCAPTEIAKLDPLAMAIESRDEKRFASLMKDERIDLNLRDDWGQTPLTRSAGLGWTDAAATLIEHGADVNLPDATGTAPITHAVLACGDAAPPMIKLLARHGAVLDGSRGSGERSRRVLITAAFTGKSDVVRLLIRLGADVNAPGNAGFTPLHAAAAMDDAESIDALLIAGASAAARDNRGDTPLDVAIDRNNRAAAGRLSLELAQAEGN
jgi:ankyrin repeat protein